MSFFCVHRSSSILHMYHKLHLKKVKPCGLFLPFFYPFLPPASALTLNISKSPLPTPTSARSFVASNTTLGTFLSLSLVRASNASFHRFTHKHHLQPSVRPTERRSLPRDALKSRNSLVTMPGERQQAHRGREGENEVYRDR
jgi:hypothetical protein